MDDTTRIRPVYLLGSHCPSAPPSLVVICGPDLGRRIPLAAPTLTIGRDAGCDVVVPIDGISRRHCELMQRDGVRLRDLGSTNGTWLNGRELEPGEEALLQTGDRVELVGVAFKFLAGNDLEAQYHEELYQLAIVDGLTRIVQPPLSDGFPDARDLALPPPRAPALAAALRHRPLQADQRPLRPLRGRRRTAHDRRGRARGRPARGVSGALRRRRVRRRDARDRARGSAHRRGAHAGPRRASRFEASGRAIPVTISVGVAALAPEMADAEAMLAAADAQLYAAKQAGRNAAVGRTASRSRCGIIGRPNHGRDRHSHGLRELRESEPGGREVLRRLRAAARSALSGVREREPARLAVL